MSRQLLASASKPSLDECLNWLEEPELDPKTGQPFISDVRRKRLLRTCDDTVRSLVYTEEECQAWRDNPYMNPKTGRSIKKYGPVWNLYSDHCHKYQQLGEIAQLAQVFEQIPEETDEPSLLYRAVFYCRLVKCSIPRCGLQGFAGINMSRLPAAVRKRLLVFIPILTDPECCCFCYWHFCLALLPFLKRTAIPTDQLAFYRDMEKVQGLIDKMDAEHPIDKLLKKEGDVVRNRLVLGFLTGKPDRATASLLNTVWSYLSWGGSQLMSMVLE